MGAGGPEWIVNCSTLFPLVQPVKKEIGDCLPCCWPVEGTTFLSGPKRDMPPDVTGNTHGGGQPLLCDI